MSLTSDNLSSAQLGAKMSEAIDKSGFKPTRVAAELDVSESTLRRYLEGKTDPSYLQIVRLADLTGHEIDWFVGNGRAK